MDTESRTTDAERAPGAALVPIRPPATIPDEAEVTTVDAARLGDVDEWGRSESFRATVRRIFDPIYRRWFRAEWEGLENLPQSGGALFVANHSGAIPADEPVITHFLEQHLDRPIYSLADRIFPSIPLVGIVWARYGGVVAHPDNAYRLLREQQQLALVFPEGTKGTGKLYKDRYRVQRFGRGGFVELAMRAGVPVVPIAVMGSEEAMPMIAKSQPLAKLLGVPYVPLTANMLLFGPLGLFWFPAKMRLRVLEPVTFDVPPDLDRYSRSRVLDESEKIRRRLQDALNDMLSKRQSVWFG